MNLAPLLKTKEVLDLLGCDEDTLREIVREGRLPRVQISARIVRYDPADVKQVRDEMRPIPWSERSIELPSAGSDQAGFVYFVRCQTFLKIGFTSEVDPKMPERMKMLQTGCPYPLRLICKVAGSRHIEKKLHRKFSRTRARGEWFSMCTEVKGFLDLIASGAELESLL